MSNFELPNGLPKVIQGLRDLIADPTVSHVHSPLFFEAKRLLAAIPSMVEEIGRQRKALDVLQSDCAECFAKNEQLHAQLHGMQDGALVRDQAAEIDRLRALNAEMRKALQQIAARDFDLEARDKARAILAKSEASS